MKESYEEQLAIDFGHKPYAGSSNVPGVAWVRGDAGQPLSSEIKNPVCRLFTDKGKATSFSPTWQGEDGHVRTDTAESQNLGMCRSFKRENREILATSIGEGIINHSGQSFGSGVAF